MQKKKNRTQLIDEALPQFEHFIESRESYIKALEATIDVLKRENQQFTKSSMAIRSSIDELVAMQRLSSSISTGVNAEQIVCALIELTQQVIPVRECNIFLFDHSGTKLTPLSSNSSERLHAEAIHHMESGIIDWVISEKKTVIIPDLEHLVANGTARNFVIVPLALRNRAIGVYVVHTGKAHKEFSNQDIQLLSVLANQTAVGVANLHTHDQLVKANEELKSSQAQIMQTAKLAAIGELAASIVHEIKNPLQILMMHIELVQLGKPVSNWVEMFGQQVKRLVDISKRLMNFARNVSDDYPMEPVSTNKAVEDIVAIVKNEFCNDNIEVHLSLKEDLPPIMGNANSLQQVFLNLLINARDAMPTGGVISVNTETEGGFVVTRFSDTGAGIEPENLERIFSTFFTTKGAGKGTGLGLAICSKIISQHEGTICVESEIDKGTTFTIRLPIGRTRE